MNKIITVLIVMVGALGYLAADQTPEGIQLDPNLAFPETPKELNQLLVEGVESRDPYWLLKLGLRHRLGGWLPEGVERDSALGVSLIEHAMDAGYAYAGDMWVSHVDRTIIGSRRAAAAGSHQGIRHLAYAEALSYCDSGVLPSTAMSSFLDEFEEQLFPSHYLDFAPPRLPRSRPAQRAELVSQLNAEILADIPAHFEKICANKEVFESNPWS
jgi:hypothetical protein